MLFEEENLIPSETERKLQIYIEQLINDLYEKEKIEVNSKKLLELLSYLTSNENISTEMKTATEYQNRKITDILHKKEVEQLKKYIKYLEQNSAEIKQKNTELAEKNAEIEKKDKIIDEMIGSFIDLGFGFEYCNNDDRCINDCDKCIKQYFERKVNSSEQN